MALAKADNQSTHPKRRRSWEPIEVAGRTSLVDSADARSLQATIEAQLSGLDESNEQRIRHQLDLVRQRDIENQDIAKRCV